MTERAMNNLLAVWTQGGGVQVGQPNYPWYIPILCAQSHGTSGCECTWLAVKLSLVPRPSHRPVPFLHSANVRNT